jgi:archaellum component FlaF (FlaF/FlaG flagellin family)
MKIILIIITFLLIGIIYRSWFSAKRLHEKKTKIYENEIRKNKENIKNFGK